MNNIRVISILTLLLVVPALAKPASPPPDDRPSIMIVFHDGHHQTVAISDIARIEFKAPVQIIFKDGHQQNIPLADIARMEFENEGSALLPSHNHFVGKWEVGDGNGSNFYITLDADGEARKTLGASHGTWTLVDGDARISWDDGWHDMIRKVGSAHEKFAFEPGKSFSDPPSNVTPAKNTEPRPI
jgi:hypothetical protein